MLRDTSLPENDHDLDGRLSDFVNFVLENLDNFAPDTFPNLQFADEFDFLQAPVQVPPTSPVSHTRSVSPVSSGATEPIFHTLQNAATDENLEVSAERSVSAAPQYMPSAAAPVISEAVELDLSAKVLCTFATYLGFDYHEVALGNLLNHLNTCPLGRVRTFCTHCFKHGPVSVVYAHELICSDKHRPNYAPSSDGSISE
jgi:hypothetical protein